MRVTGKAKVLKRISPALYDLLPVISTGSGIAGTKLSPAGFWKKIIFILESRLWTSTFFCLMCLYSIPILPQHFCFALVNYQVSTSKSLSLESLFSQSPGVMSYLSAIHNFLIQTFTTLYHNNPVKSLRSETMSV